MTATITVMGKFTHSMKPMPPFVVFLEGGSSFPEGGSPFPEGGSPLPEEGSPFPEDGSPFPEGGSSFVEGESYLRSEVTPLRTFTG